MSFQVNNNRPPFPSPFGQQSPPPPGSRPGPPPPPGAPGALPRAPDATPQTALQPPNVVPNRPSGPPPPFGLRPPPPGAFPSVAPSPPGPRPGSFQSSPMITGQVVPPSGGAPNPFSNGPPAFGSGDMQVGSRFPAAGSMPRPPVGPPPAPPMSLAPSMHSFLGSPPSGSLPGPAQLAPPFSAPPQGVPPPPSGSSSFSAPLQGMPPPSGSSPFSAPPQGMPPPTGSPFGSRTWAMQPQQAMPPQPPQMFGMPPPLPDQSMAAISPALSHTGTAVAGPSKIDPNQIPRPIPSSSVVLHETRQGNQANPPPPATSEYIVRDTGNCSPRYMRCTINQIPCTNDLLGTSGMQLALLVQPLALPHPSEEPIQVVDFGESGPVRCSRCKGYINPFMKFIDQGRRFICNLCGFTDDTPREYHCNLGPDGRRRDADERPELCRGTVEFVATKEYMVRDPMPALFFFLVDVSMNAIQTGATAAACSAINQVITDLPEGPRTMVGIATFDSTIHFYNLKRALQQPLMLIVPDIQEVYTPLQSDVIVQLSECRQHLEFLLESIPTMFQNNRNADSAFGAAIKAAFLAMKSTGGKLMVFQSVLPSVGIGALSARDAEGRTNISSAEKEAHKLLQPADKTLKTMAIEFAEYQVCVDVFITTQTYIDIASISVIPRTTGGQVYYYYPFSAVSDPAKLYNDLRWNITRPQGFEAVMRVRSSQGLQVQEYSGNFCKRIPTDVDLPAIDCDKTIMVTLKHDEKLQDGAECAFQCALLYTTVYGQRRIRVSTLSLPCTTMLSNLFRSADLDTQFACFLKQVANEIPTSPLLQVREQVTTLCISILHSYRKFCATVSSAGQLILPEALKLLPLYTLENCCWLSYLDCCALSIERRSSLPTSPTSALGVRKRKSSKKRPGSQNSSFDYRREEQLHRIPGRMFLNDSSEVASLFTQQGKKGTNQDAMIVWENFGSRIDTIFYSVFDGYGPYGYMVAKRVRDSLPLKLSAHWEVNLKSDDVLRDVSLNTTGSMNSESTSFLSADEESRASVDVEETEKHLDLFQALKDSFLKAYKVMDRELKMYTNIDCFCSGTTAVTLVKQEDYFYDLPYNTGCQIFVLRLRKTRDEIMKCTLSIDIYFD